MSKLTTKQNKKVYNQTNEKNQQPNNQQKIHSQLDLYLYHYMKEINNTFTRQKAEIILIWR